MNIQQNDELLIQFDIVRKNLLKSGKDLGNIQIVLKRGATKSYITRRIETELRGADR